MLQGENCKIEKQFLSKVKTYITQHNVVRATGHYLVELTLYKHIIINHKT